MEITIHGWWPAEDGRSSNLGVRAPRPDDTLVGMTSPDQDSIAELSDAIRAFAAERNWAQFHTPKNLVMALSVETAELVEIFQWLTPEQAARVMESPEAGEHVREEVADVFSYLLSVCIALDIDLAQALRDKMVKNALKHPAPAADAENTRLPGTHLPGA